MIRCICGEDLQAWRIRAADSSPENIFRHFIAIHGTVKAAEVSQTDALPLLLDEFFAYRGKLRNFVENKLSMTQIVLNIKDESVIPTLTKVMRSFNGVTIARGKESAYETSKREKSEGKINVYASADDFFAKMEA